jgi:hypothetical protein
LKRRDEGKVSICLNPLPKMMMKAQTTPVKILARMAVIVAAVALTVEKVLIVRRVLRRLISPAEIAEKLAL